MPNTVVLDDVFFSLARSGIARLWREVLTVWSDQGTLDERGLELVILNRSDLLTDLGFRSCAFPSYDFQHPAADRLLLTRVCDDLDASVFASTYHTFAHGVPSLSVVYDLIPEAIGFQDESRGWMERRLALAHATRFVCISRSTATDLLRYYPMIDSRKVTWALPGVRTDLFRRRPGPEAEAFKRDLGLGDFALMVGSRHQREGYKNGGLVLEALRQGGFTGLDLVCVGGEPLLQVEEDVAREAGCRFLRIELDDPELVTCMSAASLLCYPSKYEGFGLPALEALAVGTPVVVTRTSSLPEAVGPLGLFISGEEPAELGDQVRRAMGSTWSRMILKDGPEWARSFSWRILAEEIADALLECSQTRDASAERVDEFLQSYTLRVVDLQR